MIDDAAAPQSSRRYRERSFRVLGPEDTARAPQSLEAEAKFISCCFHEQSASLVLRARSTPLLPRHFADPRHGIVWAKICDCTERGLPVTIELLAEELQLTGELDRVGGVPFLLEISRTTATSLEASRYLDLVLDYAMVRQGIADTTEAGQILQGWRGEELDAIFGKISLTYQRLSDAALRRKRPSQKQIAENAQAYAQAAMDGKLDRSRVMPIGGLPHTTSAFLPFDIREEDWFILIGALRNGGKSTIARQHVGHNLVAGRTFAVFLLETSKTRWLNALAAMFAGVNLRELDVLKQLFPEKARRFQEWSAWVTSIMEEQLWIFDDVFYIEDIEREIRQINRRVRERQITQAIEAGHTPEEAEKIAYGLDGVLGDHLHLVQTRSDFRGNREREVSHIGRKIKLLAKGLDLPNFWCAQLNRGPSKDERRPTMSDLRDSGTLEQDADCVLLLHKPTEDKTGAKQTGDQSVHEVELIQGKRRNGPANVAVDLLHYLKLGVYEEVTNGATARPGMLKPANGYKREVSQ